MIGNALWDLLDRPAGHTGRACGPRRVRQYRDYAEAAGNRVARLEVVAAALAGYAADAPAALAERLCCGSDEA